VDIVHTFHETSDLWAGLVARISGVPVLISSRRDMGILRLTKHRLGYRMMNRMFDQVLTVSEQVRQFSLETDHLSPGKVTTLYNGVDLRKMSEKSGNYRASLSIPPSAPIVVTVGHVRRVKGIDVFVEAAAKVVQEIPDAIFMVVGRITEQEHFAKVQARIAELRLERNVRFFGESEDVLSILRECDIFFLPSRSEGFSNALIQAMACSLPCVATRVGGNGEAIEEGGSGYVVENEDAESAAARIFDLIRNPEKAKQMGARGRRIVEQRFTTDIMVQQLTGCYDRLLAERVKARQ
jgi:glycosyltransferase involved in cell wall biosynthesis